jgi:hypothetical protein
MVVSSAKEIANKLHEIEQALQSFCGDENRTGRVRVNQGFQIPKLPLEAAQPLQFPPGNRHPILIAQDSLEVLTRI